MKKDKKNWKLELEEYIKQSESDKAEKSKVGRLLLDYKMLMDYSMIKNKSKSANKKTPKCNFCTFEEEV